MAFLRLSLEPPPVHLYRALAEARRELRDWSSVWPHMMPLVTADALATVTAQGAPIGASWPALSPDYAARKAREHRAGAGHYVYSGRFMAGLSSGDHRERMSKAQMQWGPRPKYVYPLNYGSDGTPARAFLGLSAGVTAQILEAMERRLAEVCARADANAGGA